MESCAIQESNFSSNVEKPAGSLKVTERDLEILRFILEMKFATLPDIKKKFFRFTKEGTESTSLWPTYERVQKLIKFGLIIVENELFKEKLLLIGEKGFYYLLNSYPYEHFCRPVRRVDVEFPRFVPGNFLILCHP